MNHLGAVESLLLPFGLVLTRVSAFVAACPPFLPDSLARIIKVGCVLMLTLVLLFTHPLHMPAIAWPVAFCLEMLVGATMGMVLRLAAVAINYAGELFDLNVGFGFAHQLNPLTAETVGPLTFLAQIVGSLLFFVAGGQRVVIAALAQSFVRVPPGTGEAACRWGAFVAREIGTAFVAGVKMAMPLMALMLGVQLCLALVARVAPQLNIWAIGFLATTGASLLALWVYLPAWSADIVTTWQAQTEALAALWSS